MWEGWQSVCWKSSRKWARFQTPYQGQDMVVSQDGHMYMFLCFASRCSSLLWSSILLQTSRGSGCILALWLRFHFWASLLALFLFTHSHHNFLPFWCRNNQTTSAVTVLETTNLCKCTHLFVSRYLIEFPSKWDGCLHTSHTFNWISKQDRSWWHTLPTESTLCKISSLAVRCSAVIANCHGCREKLAMEWYSTMELLLYQYAATLAVVPCTHSLSPSTVWHA